jgi:hypothetical protein
MSLCGGIECLFFLSVLKLIVFTQNKAIKKAAKKLSWASCQAKYGHNRSRRGVTCCIWVSCFECRNSYETPSDYLFASFFLYLAISSELAGL